MYKVKLTYRRCNTACQTSPFPRGFSLSPRVYPPLQNRGFRESHGFEFGFSAGDTKKRERWYRNIPPSLSIQCYGETMGYRSTRYSNLFRGLQFVVIDLALAAHQPAGGGEKFHFSVSLPSPGFWSSIFSPAQFD